MENSHIRIQKRILHRSPDDMKYGNIIYFNEIIFKTVLTEICRIIETYAKRFNVNILMLAKT